MLKRAIGALRLDEQTYADIAANPAATREALLIVLLDVTIIALTFQFGLRPSVPTFLPLPAVPDTLLGAILYQSLFWPLEMAAIYFLVIRLFGGTGTFVPLFRTVAFANLPRLLVAAAFGVVYAIFVPVGAAAIAISLAVGFSSLWWLLATLKAIRIASGVSTGRALVALVLGNTAMSFALGYGLGLVGLASVS